MNIQNASEMEINESQFSDVHGDQNIHHHVQSVQVDGQNNMAIFHEDRRGTLDNRIINENCSNMVVFGQGQNCQVTLDSVDLSFLRNRMGQRTLQSPSSHLRNEGQLGVPPRGAQNNTNTEASLNASYQGHNSTFIDRNTGPVTIIGQGVNNEAQSRVGSATSSRQSMPVRTSSFSHGDQYTSVEERTPPILTSASDQTTVRPTSPVPETTVPEQPAATGKPGYSSIPPGAAFSLQTAGMTSFEGPQRDTREREPVMSSPEVRATAADQIRERSRAESGTGTPKLANKIDRMVRGADTYPRKEVVAQEQGMGPSSSNQKSKNIIQRMLSMFKKWKSSKKKTRRVQDVNLS